MIGQTLSHYKIIEKLGQGGMGEVYRAVDTTLDRDVALKVLPEEFAREPERRKRFEREAKAVAALKHPNIVTIHTVQEADGVHFLTMEFVEGGTLASAIPDGGQELTRFFDVAIPLTDAVSSAHAKGVAHRDLKPANIMFDADGRLKVLDFGLAKLFEPETDPDKTTGPESDTAEGKVLGTAAYMSPEQAEGSKIDHRSDIFSLGIIFYEMLTGEKPFTGKTSISTLSSVLRDTPSLVTEVKPGLPHHLGRIVRRCLEKDPDRRFQTVLDLRNDLRDLKEEMGEDVLTASTSSHPAAATARTETHPNTTTTTSSHGVAPGGGTGRVLKLAIPGVLVLAVIAVFMTMRSTETVVEQGERIMRLAVLPFENLGSPDDEYFADGITDEITAKLAGINGLSVISRASAKKYKGTDKDMRTIGDELRVDYIIEGTIRWDKSGELEKVRITPQLINVADDSHLWAENYEREIDEIFAVQADIAKEIASALDVTLGSDGGEADEPPTDNVVAYQAYLRAMEIDEETDDGMRMQINLLERAIEIDPMFASAWARLSSRHSGMVHYGFDRTSERREMARRAADRAKALAPQSVDAYIAEGYYHYWGHKNYERALEPIDFAERLAPNDPEVLAVKSFVLRRQGKFEECLVYMKRAFELDPQNAVNCRDIATTLRILRQQDEAMEYFEKAIDITPDFANSYTMAAWGYLGVGDRERALATLNRAPGANRLADWDELWLRYILGQYDEIIELGTPRARDMSWDQETAYPFAFWVGSAHARKGNTAEAGRYFKTTIAVLEQELQRLPDDHRLNSAMGVVYATLGRKEEAIRYGTRGSELMTAKMDAIVGLNRVYDMALIYAMVGEPDLAVDALQSLLDRPSEYTAQFFELDPGLAPIREHPRYKELVEL